MTSAASFGRSPRSALTRLTVTEARLALREPVGLIFGVGLPTVLLIIFGSIPFFHKPIRSLGGFSYLDVYLTIMIALTIAMLGLVSLPGTLVTYREQGVLRRLSTTPVPPAWVLAAQVTINLVLALVAMAIIVFVSAGAFSAKLPGSVVGFVLALILSIAALVAMGMWVAAVARTAKASGAIGMALFFPLMFFAGLWIPRPLMPAFLREISNLTPLGAAVQALQAAFQGSFPPVGPLLVLTAYAMIFGLLAVKFFSGE